MEGKIVFEGKGFIIRYPQADDAQEMCNYINALSKEQTYVRFQGEEVALENETKYLESQLKKISKNRSVELFVVSNNKIIGIAAIDLKDKTESHEGVLGISISKEFRGEGLGKTLMRLIIEEAEKNLPELRIISLGVFGDNTLAQQMYKKFGFNEYGRLPEGSKHKDKFVDHIYMFKKIK